MAFTKVYDMTWRSNNASGTIEIQQDGGSYETSLKLLTESLEIRNILPSWEDQIIRQSCTFTIVNDLDDFFDIIPLMTMEDGKWKVIVKETAPDSAEHILFEGFLNVETISIPLLKWGELTLTSSGYLSKLDNVHLSSFNTIESNSLIDVINSCLLGLGTAAAANIRVNSSMREENSPLGTGQTLFNRTGVANEAFWENNLERMSALEIIESILKPFNCYLYRYDGYWYIERYGDLVGTSGSYSGGLYHYSKSYVEYSYGSEYGYEDSGSEVDLTLVEWRVHNSYLKQAESKLSIIPGLKTFDIKLNRKNYTNLFNPDLSDITTHTTSEPTPSQRQWMAYTYDGYTVGELLDDLGLIAYNNPQSVYFLDLDATVPNWTNRGKPYANIANAVRREGFDHIYYDGFHNGLTTSFRVSVYEIVSGLDAQVYQTSLNIKFKYASVPYYMNGWSKNTRDRMTVQFHYYLRCVAEDEYYYYDQDDGEWKTSSDSPMEAESWDSYIEINGSEIDPNFYTYEGSIEVPIGELLGKAHDTIEFIFCLGQEKFKDPEEESENWMPGMLAYYGDITASISNSYKFNSLIRGELSSEFYDKRSIDLDLFDDENWNLRNILLYGNNWVNRTMYWGDFADVWRDSDEGGGWDDVTRNIAKYLLEEKFRLYHVARQKLNFSYKSEELLRPLLLFKDDKQGTSPLYKKFILCSETFKPESDMHEVELREYDNSTDITLE